jgi:hypothetical protein
MKTAGNSVRQIATAAAFRSGARQQKGNRKLMVPANFG